jgi:alpha-L-arabinofuranosidase
MRRLSILVLSLAISGCGSSSSSRERTDSGNGSAVATITIDTAQRGKAVTQRLFGTNIESCSDWSGRWDTTNDRWNPDHVRLAGQAALGVIRFPGGAYAQTYHWASCIGSRSSRPLGVSPFDGLRYRNDVGTDEILDLCSRIGAEPLFQLNIGFGRAAEPPSPTHPDGVPAVAAGTPEEAAAWVRYCNATTRRVKRWEMGNEQWLAGFERMPATTYVERYRTWATAMRAADPGIVIGAIGARNFGNYRFGDDPDWDRTVFTALGAQMDFVAVHNAYGPLVPLGPAGADFWQVYQSLFAFPVQVERNLVDIGNELTAYARDGGRIALAITEWGPLFDIIWESAWLDHPKTLGSAVAMARLLNVFIRTDRVDMANQFKFDDAVYIGLVSYQGVAKAGLAAMELYARHHGDVVVPAVVDSPTFDSRAVGVIAAETGVPYLDASATLSTDGRTLYLHVVNTHLTDGLATRIRIDGFAPDSDAVSWRVSGAAIDANNGADLAPGLPYGEPITAPTGSRFAAGAPGTIVVRRSDVGGCSEDFVLTFPALTATTLELHRVSVPSAVTATGAIIPLAASAP